MNSTDSQLEDDGDALDRDIRVPSDAWVILAIIGIVACAIWKYWPEISGWILAWQMEFAR